MLAMSFDRHVPPDSTTANPCQTVPGKVAQVLVSPTQNSPNFGVHAAWPHTQALSFATLPSTTVHAATFAHLLMDAKQNRPLDAVQSFNRQSFVPQVHALAFALLPSLTVQGGPVEQRLLDA